MPEMPAGAMALPTGLEIHNGDMDIDMDLEPLERD